MTELIYQTDSYCQTFTATITAVDENSHALLLDRTAFYPGGGGQPYDLGVLLRGDPVELMQGDPTERARWLADRTGLDATAAWEWGAVERVSSGLVCHVTGMQLEARQFLEAAEYVTTAGTP